MQRKITVCNQPCDKGHCLWHTARIPVGYNPRLIEQRNKKGCEGCLKVIKKELKTNDIHNKT